MAQAEQNARALIIFARYPEVGRVKTRLAAGVGPQTATELYKCFVSQILQESFRCMAFRLEPFQAVCCFLHEFNFKPFPGARIRPYIWPSQLQ